ncbi:hypothetical protein FQA39_LY03693 [Lamprigera yunnana]|nr:hypothetical protein FQA39_LY03693 [Lamprigera yunnana]
MANNTEDPLFNINLVKAIENRPCIWDYNLSDYSNRNKIDKTWKEVAEEVKDTVSNCRERWRNIRGSFFRSLKKSPSGSRTNAKKRYYLTDYLEFIRPYTKSKASTGNLETILDNVHNSEEGNSDSQEDMENRDLASQSRGDEISENVNEPSREETIATPTNTTKRRKVSLIPSSATNPVDEAFVDWHKNEKEKDDFRKEDANRSFLLSLLPDMWKMTDKQNRRFRQRVICLADEILEDADIRPCSNLSWSTNSRTSADPYAVACPTPSLNMTLSEGPVRNKGLKCPIYSDKVKTV